MGLCLTLACQPGQLGPDPRSPADSPGDNASGDLTQPVLEVQIVSPSNGATVDTGWPVSLVGEASLGGVTLTTAQLSWSSNLEGAIGQGAERTWRPSAPGQHTITVRGAIDDLSAEASVGIEVVLPWDDSTPEAQGMDSDALADMFEFIRADHELVDGELHGRIDSVLVIRHGTIVVESYIHPSTAHTAHLIYSATKTVTAGLVGILLGNDFAAKLDWTLPHFFPNYFSTNPTDWKKDVTTRDFLTMRSCLPPDVADDDTFYSEPDPAAWCLARRVEPDCTIGQDFNYSGCNQHLFSKIITDQSGTSTLDFANEHLFGPLGIRPRFWMADQQGVSLGRHGLYLEPLDMAKIGRLFLDQGQWLYPQANQTATILPPGWVEAATQRLVDPSHFASNYCCYDSYGFWTWLFSDQVDLGKTNCSYMGDCWPGNCVAGFSAMGLGGQFIRVFPQPDLDLVVVITASVSTVDPDRCLISQIRNAIRANGPLPPNPTGVDRLNAVLLELANPVPVTPVISPTAEDVTGKRRTLDPVNPCNVFDATALTLQFQLGAADATLELETSTITHPLSVGLDDVFRSTDVGAYTIFQKESCCTYPTDNRVAARGVWESDSAFLVELIQESEAFNTHLRLTIDNPEPGTGTAQISEVVFWRDAKPDTSYRLYPWVSPETCTIQ